MTENLASFEGTLADTDVKRHLEFTFTCSPGAAGLELILTFEPAEIAGIRNPHDYAWATATFGICMKY